jgi:hypothetical protein
MATGENNTTWGDVTNLNLGTALEEAIVGSADVTFASADVTLTLTDTNASQTARNMRLRCTGTTGGSTRNLIVPSIEKPYIVRNDCADSVVVKTAAGTGITVPAGKTMWVYTDATNVVDAVTHLSSLTLGTDLAVTDGGTGASTFTANGVIYGNTTSALLATAAGTTGQVLVGNTGGAPSWATLTGIGVTSFSAGTTGLTPNTATTGAITLAGTLGVANGGTGTNTAFTAGSVVFAGASGVYSQDNANLFWDNSNDRLGIGTTSPDNKLEVTVGDNAGINIEQASANQTGFFNFRDADGALAGRISYDHSNNSMRLATNETEKVRITSAGDVGIGTSSPATKLDVEGASNTQVGVRTPYSAAGSTASPIYQSVSFFGYAGAERARITGIDTAGSNVNGQLAFWTGQGGSMVEAMRIDAVSNVGIGTSSPAGRLGVDVGAAGTPQIVFGQSSDNPFVTINRWIGSGASFYGVRLTNSVGDLTISTAPSGSQDGGQTFTERMRVTSAGNVGIGTSSPLTKLVVSDATNGFEFVPASTSILQTVSRPGGAFIDLNIKTRDFIVTGNNTEAMRVTNTGSVGIGTSAPGYTLDVRTNASNAIRVGSSGNSFGTLLSWDNPTGEARLSSIGAFALTFGTNTTERMRIDSSGNVGIGVTPVAGYGTSIQFSQGASTTVGALLTQAINTNDQRVSLANNALPPAGGFTGTFNYTLTGASATRYEQGGGAHTWFNAPTGTAGNAITFTQAMTLDASGNLGIGTAPTTNTRLYVRTATITDTAYYADNGANSGFKVKFASSTTSILNDFAGALVLGTNDTERMRISGAGDVGIGTATPDIFGRFYTRTVGINSSGTSMLQINGTTYGGIDLGFNGTRTATMLAETGGFYLQTTTASAMSLGTNTLERMRITSAGDVGIGTSSPTAKLQVAGTVIIQNSNAYDELTFSGTEFTNIYSQTTSGMQVGTTASSYLALVTNNTERARINSSGAFMVGCTGIDTDAPNVNASIYMGSGNYKARNSTEGFQYLQFYGTSVSSPIGSISNVSNTGVSYNTSSDYRLKDIDGPVANSGAYIDALNPVQGSWKTDGSRFIGLLAHEVQEVSETPIATGEKDGEEMQAMDYSAPELIANLIAELQSLRARVAQLEGN